MNYFILIALYLAASATALPADSSHLINNDEAKAIKEQSGNGQHPGKIIGSRVVTSVSVVMNGQEPQFTDNVGKPVPRPLVPPQVASPIELLNPDRYEFYTFNDGGELVKRLMTKEEIASIVAGGDGEGSMFINNQAPDQIDTDRNVDNILVNVQNVLSREVEANKNKSGNMKPMLDTPDTSSSWNLILPAIFGNTGGDISPPKPQQVVMTPDSIVMEQTTPPPRSNVSPSGTPHYRVTTTTRKPTKHTTKTTTIAPVTESTYSTRWPPRRPATTQPPTTANEQIDEEDLEWKNVPITTRSPPTTTKKPRITTTKRPVSKVTTPSAPKATTKKASVTKTTTEKLKIQTTTEPIIVPETKKTTVKPKVTSTTAIPTTTRVKTTQTPKPTTTTTLTTTTTTSTTTEAPRTTVSSTTKIPKTTPTTTESTNIKIVEEEIEPIVRIPVKEIAKLTTVKESIISTKDEISTTEKIVLSTTEQSSSSSVVTKTSPATTEKVQELGISEKLSTLPDTDLERSPSTEASIVEEPSTESYKMESSSTESIIAESSTMESVEEVAEIIKSTSEAVKSTTQNDKIMSTSEPTTQSTMKDIEISTIKLDNQAFSTKESNEKVSSSTESSKIVDSFAITTKKTPVTEMKLEPSTTEFSTTQSEVLEASTTENVPELSSSMRPSSFREPIPPTNQPMSQESINENNDSLSQIMQSLLNPVMTDNAGLIIADRTQVTMKPIADNKIEDSNVFKNEPLYVDEEDPKVKDIPTTQPPPKLDDSTSNSPLAEPLISNHQAENHKVVQLIDDMIAKLPAQNVDVPMAAVNIKNPVIKKNHTMTEYQEQSATIASILQDNPTPIVENSDTLHESFSDLISMITDNRPMVIESELKENPPMTILNLITSTEEAMKQDSDNEITYETSIVKETSSISQSHAGTTTTIAPVESNKSSKEPLEERESITESSVNVEVHEVVTKIKIPSVDANTVSTKFDDVTEGMKVVDHNDKLEESLPKLKESNIVLITVKPDESFVIKEKASSTMNPNEEKKPESELSTDIPSSTMKVEVTSTDISSTIKMEEPSSTIKMEEISSTEISTEGTPSILTEDLSTIAIVSSTEMPPSSTIKFEESTLKSDNTPISTIKSELSSTTSAIIEEYSTEPIKAVDTTTLTSEVSSLEPEALTPIPNKSDNDLNIASEMFHASSIVTSSLDNMPEPDSIETSDNTLTTVEETSTEELPPSSSDNDNDEEEEHTQSLIPNDSDLVHHFMQGATFDLENDNKPVELNLFTATSVTDVKPTTEVPKIDSTEIPLESTTITDEYEMEFVKVDTMDPESLENSDEKLVNHSQEDSDESDENDDVTPTLIELHHDDSDESTENIDESNESTDDPPKLMSNPIAAVPVNRKEDLAAIEMTTQYPIDEIANRKDEDEILFVKLGEPAKEPTLDVQPSTSTTRKPPQLFSNHLYTRKPVKYDLPQGNTPKKPTPINLSAAPKNSLGLAQSTVGLNEDLQKLSQLSNELAFNFWRTVNGTPSRSLVISPYAITSMLSLLFLGARGGTSGEMNEVLRLDEMTTFNPHLVFRNITDSSTNPQNAGVASSVIVRELFSDRAKGKLLQFYKDKATQFYSAHVEEASYSMINDIIRRRTNILVKRASNGNIPYFMKTNTVWLQPPLSAISANIFQTDCSKASTSERDREMYFQVAPAIRQRRLVPIPAAVLRSGFTAGYDPNLDATAVAFGSSTDTISTIFLMPGQQGHTLSGDTLERLESDLISTGFTKDTWHQLLTTLMPRDGLEVQIPRFIHRSYINASASLQQMGLTKMFDSEHADLRGLTGTTTRELHFTDMLQINEFATCADDKQLYDQNYVETYPMPPSKERSIPFGEELEDIDDEMLERYKRKLVEPQDYQRSFYDPLYDPTLLDVPLPLRPRQARLPEAPRLRFDRPFMYFVRHNPTGIILHMGRFNPRLLPST